MTKRKWKLRYSLPQYTLLVHRDKMTMGEQQAVDELIAIRDREDDGAILQVQFDGVWYEPKFV
jgi:hypothetical protein